MKKPSKFILKSFFIRLIIFIPLVILMACSTGAQQEMNIPDRIIEKGNQFIISKTGLEFFDKYIKPDLFKSKKINDGYFLLYQLEIPEKSYVKGVIRFTTDSLGTVLTDREIAGIPNCINSPADCNFIIDESQAVEIARENNLEDGIKEWKKVFGWDAVYNKYIWRILSTLHERTGDFGYRGNGKEIIIDTNTGEVLAVNEWRIN